MEYKDITIEECFIKYHTEKIASIFDADKKEVTFMEE